MSAEEIESKYVAEDDSDEGILELSRNQFQLCEEAWTPIYSEGADDLRFVSGEQWDEKDKQARAVDGRPCLVNNRLIGPCRQTENDFKQNRPGIKVSPVDEAADIETAKVLQGTIRHIENVSSADVAYGRAYKSAIRSGIGFWRIITEFCDPYSFDQELRIKSVRNFASCYLDPNFQEIDGSDAEFGFAFEDITHAAFKAAYPKAKLVSVQDIGSRSNLKGWVTENTVRVCDYYYKKYEEFTLVQLSDGTTLKESDFNEFKKTGQIDPSIEVVNKRQSYECKVIHIKHNGFEILEKTEFPSKYIPIIPVLGDETEFEDGKRKLEGLVRQAKDPQRMLNFWDSNLAETLALAPRAPWIGYEGQFEGHEDEWQTANRRNHPYLEVKPVTISGQLAPLPQRNTFEPPIMALTQGRMLSSDDIKATTGVYDATLGAQSNEKSGIAIHRRNVQAQTNNFHFADNIAKSIRHTGRILVDAIPKIYDTARTVRILGDDMKEEVIGVNQEWNRNGETVRYDLGVGKYDVSISTGPSFETKRQEAAAMQADLARSHPELMQLAGDILVKNLDIPGADEIANRLRKTIPPQILDEKSDKQIPPAVQMQMAQMSQMVEQLTQTVNEQAEDIRAKRLELETKERIEMAKIQADIEINLARMGSQEAIVLLGHQIDQINRRLELLKNMVPIGEDDGGNGGGFDPGAGGGGLPPGGGEFSNMNEPPEFAPEAESFEGVGPEQAMAPIEQQPTGGLTPGEESMGV